MGVVTNVTICASSFIRTLTVGSGIAPDLLTPRGGLSADACAGARGLAGHWPTYRRWGISPRPEDAL